MLKFRFSHKEYDFYAGVVNGTTVYNILPACPESRSPMTGGYESFGYIASVKKLDRKDFELVSDWMNYELKQEA